MKGNSKMKKCVVACITMLLLIIPLRTTFTAADYEHDYNPYIIMSSQYISSCSATITPGTNGLIELNCSVIGTGNYEYNRYSDNPTAKICIRHMDKC